ARRVCPSELVVEDGLIGRRETVAAVLHRPGQAHETALVEGALPAPVQRAHLLFGLGLLAPVRRRVDQQPFADPGPEGELFGVFAVIHQACPRRASAIASSWWPSSPKILRSNIARRLRRWASCSQTWPMPP